LKYLLIIAFALVPTCSYANSKEQSTIGYATVKEALDSLKEKAGTDVSTQGGWTIISDKENGNMVLWSFTPENHDAHPAAIKRTVFEQDGSVNIRMTALCQAKKDPCDKLIEEFKELNAQIGKQMRNGS
jgi:hypothetical protein